MPKVEVNAGVELHFDDQGDGTPIIFIHGVWMSRKFFKEQLPYFSQNYRAITLDMRGHGDSTKVQEGHTISTYAKDLHSFITKLELKDVILVGWSMGAFVVWEYVSQFGESNVKGTVIVDELASDFKWPDFEIGAFNLTTLTHFMREVQENRENFLKGFIPLMFKKDVPPQDMEWMLEETTKPPSGVASAILYDQSIVDYRAIFASLSKPTLLCFGKDEKLIPVAAGEHLNACIKNSTLILFDNSCHCPFLEEPNVFNEEVARFIQSI
ncbi:alpha/beta fold hydrolase [Sutcliffiella rhizosphaerae]|uniref:AB hydrolase superfamily protein YdjP n=1 Tax=Sutcliffiella rhizosphaerae TaxID=2880967 RepID=A0ABM8YJP2_9BACI|nr:alpha/beta hydrolase [Sutcliffiella rhizosphaerae]CAG9620013.1 AB hydrolase superfamily protein YdjP [Sutcliffiella rhizosphaerae]